MKKRTKAALVALLVTCMAGAGMLSGSGGLRKVLANGQIIIAIDPGHGGFDPGTIGKTTGVEEDGLNLNVAQKLKTILEGKGFVVVMTRSDDNAIAEGKYEDMLKRREIIENSGAVLALSIHMNANASSSCSGPEAIYYAKSEYGKVLAELIQQKLNDNLNPPKKRRASSSNAYYIPKSGALPCVIVECGFLSNAREERLLMQDDYQQKIAQAIAEGVEAYISQVY